MSSASLIVKTALPPVLAGADTPAVRAAVDGFYSSVAAIFEAWVQRRESPNTQRAYREDVLAFVFHGLEMAGRSDCTPYSQSF